MHPRLLIALVAVLCVALVESASAASLGIPLDGFLQSFILWVTGLGFIVSLVGLIGWVGGHMAAPHSPILAGSTNFFAYAGLLGGGSTILGMIGLVQGAVFPL